MYFIYIINNYTNLVQCNGCNNITHTIDPKELSELALEIQNLEVTAVNNHSVNTDVLQILYLNGH